MSSVSIITPTFNSIKYIQETVDSVINQTFKDWEWYIIDDKSTDGTIEYLKNLESKDPRIHCIFKEENSGAGPSRNLGIEKAIGKYIAFIDSDDIWEKNKLEIQLKKMEENNSFLSHTAYRFIDSKGEFTNQYQEVSFSPINYKNLLRNTEIGCSTGMYNQEKLGKIYMPDIRRKQDYGLWLSILKRGVNSLPIPYELVRYRVHANSATNKKHKLIIKHWIFLRKQENLNIFESTYYTFWWALNGFKKYFLKKK